MKYLLINLEDLEALYFVGVVFGVGVIVGVIGKCILDWLEKRREKNGKTKN